MNKFARLFASKMSAVSESDVEKRKFGPEVPVEENIIKMATKQPYAGQFGVPQYSQTGSGASVTAWHSCRESFQSIFKKGMDSFAFSCSPNVGRNVAAFFARFEDQLHLKKNRTFFAMTDKENVIIVRPSEWWRKYLIRRSLFTILLRAAQSYNPKKDNFLEALYSDKYSTATKIPLTLFMKRHTLVKKTCIHSGWYGTFLNKTEDQIKEILVKPPKKKPETPIEQPVTSENPTSQTEVPEAGREFFPPAIVE